MQHPDSVEVPRNEDDAGGLTRREVLARSAGVLGVLTAGSLLSSPIALGARTRGSAVPAAVTKELAGARGFTKWVAPGPAFDAAAVKGKSIFYLPASTGVPIIQTMFNGMKEACAAVGASVNTFDAKGLPAEFNRLLDQAIGQKVDAILIEAIPPQLISAPLKRAKAQGIKLISVDAHDESFPPQSPHLDQAIALPYSRAGRLCADWVIADSGGDANVLIIATADFPAGTDLGVAAAAQFKKYAPATKVKTIGITFAQWGTVGTRVRTELTANPDLNYIIPVFDGMALGIVPGVQQAGASKRVKISTCNVTPAVMKQLKAKQVVAANVGNSNIWHGWAQMDTVFRHLVGAPRSTGEHIGLRVFDSSNINTIDIGKDEVTWFGPTFQQDLRNGFKKLWSVA